MKNYEKLVTWSHTYSVGIQMIDEQHKGLLNLVNDMYNHVLGNPEAEKAYFQKVIHQAVEYVKTHFATEEKIMRATRFDGYREHKKEHDSFILTVIEHIRGFEAGRNTLISFTNFLKDWILTHIAIMDKQYFDYFKKIATRKSDGRLSISLEDIAC